MNVVVDDAAEVYVKEAQPRLDLGMFRSIVHDENSHLTSIGRILLKGDNITLIQPL